MHRWSKALLSAAVFLAGGSLSQAAPLPRDIGVSAASGVEVPAYPPRVTPRGKPRRPSSYGVNLYYPQDGGLPRRYTYPGYKNGFPPPAFLYYGYPQNGSTTGVGF